MQARKTREYNENTTPENEILMPLGWLVQLYATIALKAAVYTLKVVHFNGLLILEQCRLVTA